MNDGAELKLKDVESVVLTGGAARRMGTDKAAIPIDGRPQAVKIAQELSNHTRRVVILGRNPIPGFDFLQDQGEFEGPLAALQGFKPTTAFVFVASCDIPLFNGAIVAVLRTSIGEALAAAPRVDGFLQPFSALYRAEVWNSDKFNEADCGVSFLKSLNPFVLEEDQLAKHGLAPHQLLGANTPSELQSLLAKVKS